MKVQIFGIFLGIFLLAINIDAAIDSQTQSNSIALLAQRSNEALAASYSPNPGYLNSLKSDGSFSDIDYTSGCKAGRAIWPASDHWVRTLRLASAWMSSGDPKLLNATRLAANYWFARDYKKNDCTGHGGTPGCPCSTPGLWNPNWWWQVIFLPNHSGPWCVLIQSKGIKMTAQEVSSCKLFLQRSWVSVDSFTAANLVWVSANGISLGIFNNDYNTVKSAFQKAFSTAKISPGLTDGIKSDGSFLQHGSLLYSGNYGQAMMNDVFSFAQLTEGIPDLYPNTSQQDALSQHVFGSEWMGYYDHSDKRFTWDPSVCGRYFASKQVRMDIPLKTIQSTSKTWKYATKLDDVVKRLNSTGDSINPGGLIGDRMFWKSDYHVHRGSNYILTLKMFSSRNINTECINSQNLQGYHQSAGVLFTFTSGTEYKDFPAVWDWKLLPGITVDPSATNLTCAKTKYPGKEKFVGGVSDKTIGASVMSFTDPMNGELSFTKSWFFFEDVYFVIVSNIQQRKGKKVYTVLDQREFKEPFDSSAGNGKSIHTENPSWMIHDKTGYLFPTQVDLNVARGEVTGDWNAVGTGWNSGKVTKNVFKSTLQTKGTSLGYIALPGVDSNDFNKWKTSNWKDSLRILSTSRDVHAVLHTNRKTYGFTFVKASNFNITNSIQISSDSPTILLLDNQTRGTSKVTLADPSQILSIITIRINGSKLSCGNIAFCKKDGKGIQLSVTLPKGEYAGSSTSIPLQGDLF